MSTLQELTNAVSVATTNYNNAVSAKDVAYGAAKAAYDILFNCVKGKGETNNCPNGQPLGSDQYPSFGNTGNSGACRICNSLKDCKSDCCKEETCVARMNDYNAKINTYNTALAKVTSTKAILDAANNNLANNPEGAAIVASSAAAAQAEGRITMYKWIFGIVVVIVIVGGIIIYFKYFRK